MGRPIYDRLKDGKKMPLEIGLKERVTLQQHKNPARCQRQLL